MNTDPSTKLGLFVHAPSVHQSRDGIALLRSSPRLTSDDKSAFTNLHDGQMRIRRIYIVGLWAFVSRHCYANVVKFSNDAVVYIYRAAKDRTATDT